MKRVEDMQVRIEERTSILFSSNLFMLFGWGAFDKIEAQKHLLSNYGPSPVSFGIVSSINKDKKNTRTKNKYYQVLLEKEWCKKDRSRASKETVSA